MGFIKLKVLLLGYFALTIAVLTGCNSEYSYNQLPNGAQLSFVTPNNSIIPNLAGSLKNWEKLTSYTISRQPLGVTTKYALNLQNIGDLAAGINQVWIDGAGGTMFTTQNLCASTIGSLETPCEIDVFFNPATIGTTPATLHVSYTNGLGANDQLDLPISATASNLAFLQFAQSTMDAGNDTIGYTVSAIYNVTYNGTAFGSAGVSILPAQGVTISNPADDEFTIDQAGTTCGNVVQADCIIKVNFSAKSTGSKSTPFSLSYFNGAEVQSISATTTGMGTAATVLATLSAPAQNFGKVVANAATPSELLVPITFSGSVPADSVSFSPPSNAAFSIDTNPSKSTCLAMTASESGSINGNCKLGVLFQPTAFVTYSDMITISYSSHGQTMTPASFTLAGQGAHPAAIQPSAQSLSFSNDPAHEGRSLSFTLTNTGDVAVSALSAITLSDTKDFTASFGTTCATLAAGASCSLTVGFTPSQAAALMTSIAFNYYDGRTTQNLSLQATGTGTAPVVLTVISGTTGVGSYNVADFGNIEIGLATLPSPKLVKLGIFGTTLISTSSQLVNSSLSTPFAFTGGTFPGTSQNCVAPLNPNKANSCTFDISLLANTGYPAGTAVTQNFTLQYTGDGGAANGSGTMNFTAKMTPQVPPVLAFTATSSTFPLISVGNIETTTLTIHNNSPYFATRYVSTGLSGDSSFTISTNSCTAGLAAGASCTIVIRYAPASAGSQSTTLTYGYNDQIANQTVSIPISGTSSANVTLTASASVVDFGTVYVGDTVAAKTVTLQYYGASTWTSSATVASPFTLDSSACGGIGNCLLTVNLQNVSPGTFDDKFQFTYAPGLTSPATLSLEFKAIVQYRQPTLTITGTGFPKTLLGSSSTQTLTIQNVGNGTAHSLTLPALSAPFAYAAGGAPGTSGSCASQQSLASQQSCTLKVSFTPTAIGSSMEPFNVGLVGSNSQAATASASLSGIGTQMAQVFAGGYQTCLINEVGKILCWGANSSGQLGQGNTQTISTTAQMLTPIAFEADAVFKKISIGDSHTCALIDTTAQKGQVTCWGNADSGRLGLPSVTTPQLLSPVDSNGAFQAVDLGTDSNSQTEVAIDVSAGFESTCAVLRSGKVKCWGANASGQLGIGSTASIGSSAAQMGNNLAGIALGTETPVSVSVGAGHTCVTFSDGGARCWGDNFYGQLGQGVTTEKIGVNPQDMASLQNIALGDGETANWILASTGAFTCVGVNSGVKCFGSAAYNETSPSPFWGILGTCWARAVYNSQAVPCWSAPDSTPSNSYGYFPTDMGNNLPVINLNSITTASMAVGSNFSCALGADQNLRCWGANDHGQLGVGSNTPIGGGQSDMGANLVSAVAPSAGVYPVSVAAGYYHACVVLSNNTVKCWGTSTEGATGLPQMNVAGDTGASALTAPMQLPVVYDGR